MSTAVNTHPFDAAKQAGREPYKVADINLADFGRREIELAQHEMPDSRLSFEPWALHDRPRG